MESAPNQVVAAVIGWWRNLHSPHGDKGARARLKRCNCVLDALLEPETHRLIASVQKTASCVDERYLAVLAIVLARVGPANERKAHRRPFAEVLGCTQDGAATGNARRRLSPMRFSALLRAGTDPDRFIQALRRTLAIMGKGSFNVHRFVQDILVFNDSTRRKWTFDYYHTGRANTLDDTQLHTKPSSAN